MFALAVSKEKILSLEGKGFNYRKKGDNHVYFSHDNYILTNKNDTIIEKLENKILTTISLNNKSISIKKNIVSNRGIYYTFQKNIFFAATSFKELKKLGVNLIENKDYEEVLSFGYINPPNTLFKNVFLLLPGQTISSDNKIKESTIDTKKKNYNMQNTIKEIKKSLRYFKKYTLLFSGGVDSSILGTYGNNKLIGCYVRFENNKEKEYIDSMKKYLTNEIELFSTTLIDYKINLIKSIKRAELPVMYPFFPVFEKLFNTTKDSNFITGCAADSIFGTKRYVYAFFLSKHKTIRYLCKILGKINTKYAQSFIEMSRINDEDFQDFFVNTTPGRRLKTFSPNKIFDKYDIFDAMPIFAHTIRSSYVGLIFDKLAESHNKNIHHPYNDLFQYSLTIPTSIKYASHKKVLTDLYQDINIPKKLLTRNKLGFGLHESIKNGLFEDLFNISKEGLYFKIPRLNLNKISDRHTYWYIVNYGIWRRLFILNHKEEQLINELPN